MGLLRTLCFALALLVVPVLAHAQGTPFVNLPASFARAANTTTYTADTAVCASTAVVCTPLAFTVPGGSGVLVGVTLKKTGTTTTNGDFVVWLYSQPPYVGTTIKDDVGYVGPFAVDVPYFVGFATCATPVPTNDGTAQVWYSCTLSNTVRGALAWNGTNTLYGMVEVTAAYAPASAEKFTVTLTGSVPQ